MLTWGILVCWICLQSMAWFVVFWVLGWLDTAEMGRLLLYVCLHVCMISEVRRGSLCQCQCKWKFGVACVLVCNWGFGM
jgi:hypothetical protein